MAEQTFKESFKVTGAQVLDAVKKLLHEGNVRRIVIKQGDRVVAEFPLTAGVVGTVLAPPLAAIGALAALIAIARSKSSGRSTRRTRRTRARSRSAMPFLIRWLVNAAALWVATRLVSGVTYTGGWLPLMGWRSCSASSTRSSADHQDPDVPADHRDARHLLVCRERADALG